MTTKECRQKLAFDFNNLLHFFHINILEYEHELKFICIDKTITVNLSITKPNTNNIILFELNNDIISVSYVVNYKVFMNHKVKNNVSEYYKLIDIISLFNN